MVVDGTVEGPGVTKLQRGYTFYYIDKRRGSSESYEDSIKTIASFRTAEGFWRVYNHLLRPHQLREGGAGEEFQLFAEGIKPTWEDPANAKGGKLVVRLPPQLTSQYWEALLLALIGEQLDGGDEEICGVIVSVRYNGDVISIWNRDADNPEFQTKLVRRLKAIWDLPPFVQMDYKRHVPEPGATDNPAKPLFAGGEGAQPPAAGGGAQQGGYLPAWRRGGGGGDDKAGGGAGGKGAWERGAPGGFRAGGDRERGAGGRREGGRREEAWSSLRDRAGSADKGEWRNRGNNNNAAAGDNKGAAGGGDPDGWEVVGGGRRGSHDRRPSR